MGTTSLDFEGAGGQTLGRHGHSKDHRPDLPQVILAVLIDGDGRPVCSELWPGHVADVTTLIPVIDRLRTRFAIGRICVVADRDMISAATVAALEEPGLLYLLATRERTDQVVRDAVLADPAPWLPLTIARRGQETDYQAKAVTVGGARYIVGRNHQEGREGRGRPRRHPRQARSAAEEGRQGAGRQIPASVAISRSKATATSPSTRAKPRRTPGSTVCSSCARRACAARSGAIATTSPAISS